MKTNIFYAMNEIDDKYILEAAQCLEHKNTGRNYRLNRDKCLNNKWMTHIVAAILIIVFVFTTGSIINATTHGKIVQWITQLFGAEIVTRENRSLIGKEINDNSVPEVTYSGERCIKQIDKNPIDNSNIIKGVANENIVLPSSISEFEVKNEVTPEIIMTNGSMAVFYVNNYKGWNCKEGDTLTFSFEKYKSETVQKQTFVIGYIRDGIMYEGESMRNIVGSYTLTIKEDGEYNLYIISSTSDYLTIKQGIINHEERRKIEVKKKKIRRCIFALWCILAIIFLIAVNIYNGNEKAENVISDLVRIYIGASFIIIGIIYKLGKNK